MENQKTDEYKIPEKLMNRLDQLITELQHLFLEIYSNYQVKSEE